MFLLQMLNQFIMSIKSLVSNFVTAEKVASKNSLDGKVFLEVAPEFGVTFEGGRAFGASVSEGDWCCWALEDEI